MSDPRFTDDTIAVVARILEGWGAGGKAAESVLGALADARLLLPPNGEPGVWWRVRGVPGRGFPAYEHDWGMNAEGVAHWMSNTRDWPVGPILERRTITSYPDGSTHYSPWEEVPDA